MRILLPAKEEAENLARVYFEVRDPFIISRSVYSANTM